LETFLVVVLKIENLKIMSENKLFISFVKVYNV
jgi:hypothetical protein